MDTSLTSLKVLVADDDLGTRELLCDYLQADGHHVILAEDGRQAMARLQEEAFQIVIIDWIMPHLDGPALCRWIRSRPFSEMTHVIMLTIYTDKAKLVEAFEAGVDDFLSKPVHEGELLARLRAWTRIIRLEQDLAEQTYAAVARREELAGLNVRLAELAAVDELTGLPNRREAMRHLREKLALSQRHGHPLACATIDIDRFKGVNDELGHAAGDWVLRELAQDLRRCLRDSDSLFRLGGDELLVILPHQSATAAAVCLERCRAAVAERKYTFEGRSVPLTISVGLAERAPNIQNAEELLKAADESLYAAKRDGRNRLHVRCAG